MSGEAPCLPPRQLPTPTRESGIPWGPPLPLATSRAWAAEARDSPAFTAAAMMSPPRWPPLSCLQRSEAQEKHRRPSELVCWLLRSSGKFPPWAVREANPPVRFTPVALTRCPVVSAPSESRPLSPLLPLAAPARPRLRIIPSCVENRTASC